jgi:hypothetical protein
VTVLHFFVFGGVILLLSGVLQILVRPRQAREIAAQRWVNRATVRMVLFLLVGVLAILVGLGVVPLVKLGL